MKKLEKLCYWKKMQREMSIEVNDKTRPIYQMFVDICLDCDGKPVKDKCEFYTPKKPSNYHYKEVKNGK